MVALIGYRSDQEELKGHGRVTPHTVMYCRRVDWYENTRHALPLADADRIGAITGIQQVADMSTNPVPTTTMDSEGNFTKTQPGYRDGGELMYTVNFLPDWQDWQSQEATNPAFASMFEDTDGDPLEMWIVPPANITAHVWILRGYTSRVTGFPYGVEAPGIFTAGFKISGRPMMLRPLSRPSTGTTPNAFGGAKTSSNDADGNYWGRFFIQGKSDNWSNLVQRNTQYGGDLASVNAADEGIYLEYKEPW